MSGGAEDAVGWARERLGVELSDSKLLERALTHKSLGAVNYERLEFLGDRVLGGIVAAWLYESFPDEPEGKLTRRFAKLVSRETCAAVARTLGIPQQVRLGVQARSDGGTNSENILGDVMEALIGAIWLDQGDAVARAFVRRCWESQLSFAGAAPKHPKSAVQEWAAAKGLRDPAYVLLRRSGPHHAPQFHVELTVAPHPPVEASGASKQEAETEAARLFLENVNG